MLNSFACQPLKTPTLVSGSSAPSHLTAVALWDTLPPESETTRVAVASAGGPANSLCLFSAANHFVHSSSAATQKSHLVFARWLTGPMLFPVAWTKPLLIVLSYLANAMIDIYTGRPSSGAGPDAASDSYRCVVSKT